MATLNRWSLVLCKTLFSFLGRLGGGFPSSNSNELPLATMCSSKHENYHT